MKKLLLVIFITGFISGTVGYAAGAGILQKQIAQKQNQVKIIRTDQNGLVDLLLKYEISN